MGARKKPKAMNTAKHAPKNPRRITKYGGLKAYDRAAWERAVRDALAKTRTLGEAAERLEVSRQQLYRWLAEPCFADLPARKRGPQPEK